LFYVTTPVGVPVRSPGFIQLASDGIAHHQGAYYRLDVPRQWLLIRELLNHQKIEVQWMFVSRDIEALLIDYALAKETDLDLVWQAETVMLEPTDSAPHDDHIHLRIACTKEEAVAGCEGGGPRWEWQSPLPHLPTGPGALERQIGHDDPLLGLASL
jgi:penicillin-insensitive murein endopeptidase